MITAFWETFWDSISLAVKWIVIVPTHKAMVRIKEVDTNEIHRICLAHIIMLHLKIYGRYIGMEIAVYEILREKKMKLEKSNII